MKLVVGLGNPGNEYKNTRHNSGFLFVDFLKEKIGGGEFLVEKKFKAEIWQNKDLIIAKPLTFMNDSGFSVSNILRFYKISPLDMVLAFDDLDINFGEFKVSFGKGPRVHNGLNSVVKQVGVSEFWHVRIGICGEEYSLIKKDQKSMAWDYILKRFSQEELERLLLVFEEILKNIELQKII
jgi:PTH1 family peptidyl-tRNA hydrolase